MTSPLPHDLAGLVLMVFLLGLRHGMDPDHLATVDGLARRNARARLLSTQAAAMLAGAELALGFGVAIVAVASFAVAMQLARPAPA
jgi:high-affinity nickel-transport protein